MRTLLLIIFFLSIFIAKAQDNYEIQVYGSQTQAPKSMIVELHSNFTFKGNTQTEKGVVPSNHALHETVEITTGITPIFEMGFYLFTSYVPGYGYRVVGSHIRPRVMAPSQWNLPVGVSLSAEVGYQSASYASDTWSLEIRPIIDKQWGKLYVSFNPTLGIALKSKYDNSVPGFEPNLKASYNLFGNNSFGLEYYGSCGPLNKFDALPQENQALFLAYDLMNNVHWELNIGAGFGLTKATDGFVFKILVGRKIKWK
ncbi:MAG: hypothetical protein JST75_15540 [Bacteroidetes bacterium]|nr:hypothetical protein [Bacteroidota bacterium]